MTKRARTAWLLCATLAFSPLTSLAHAQATSAHVDTAPTLAELGQLARELANDDREARRAAFEALRTLGEDAQPAIRARLEQLAASGFDGAAALTALSEFRRVQGVDAPDGDVDLAKGVLQTLDRNHGKGNVLGAELIALLRALEAQQSPKAAEIIVGQLFALDGKLFRYEIPRTRQRLNALIIPALIRYQTHPRPWLRGFCHDTLVEMGMDKPGRAVQQDDVALLSAILEAYGDTLTFDAMPVVVSYVTDERVEVREAARKAVRRFGKNAIWQIRERYVNATGREADANWGWERTLDELVRLHEAPKKQAFGASLATAQRALDAGDMVEAERALAAALIVDPHDPDAKRAGSLYARIAASHLDGDEIERALDTYRRALRLDPESGQASAIRARIAYLEAELRLAQGVVDLQSYRRAIELDPSFEPARLALDELSGDRAARDRMWRRVLGLLAAFLMTAGGFTLLRNAKRTAGSAPARSPDATAQIGEASGTE